VFTGLQLFSFILKLSNKQLVKQVLRNVLPNALPDLIAITKE